MPDKTPAPDPTPTPNVLSSEDFWHLKALQMELQALEREAALVVQGAQAKRGEFLRTLGVTYHFDPAAQWTLDDATRTLRPAGPPEPKP